MSCVIASIDGSASTPAVCDYAAWASMRLAAPLTFLHVLERQRDWVASELDGDIGVDERLLESQAILAAAKARAIFSGIDKPETRQRHGDVVATLKELETETSLLVIGIRGESTANQIGSHVANVVRSMHIPILVAPSTFTVPDSLLIAFDGSATVCRGIEELAASPLFKDLPVHLVMVGAESSAAWAMLDAAGATLSAAGHRTYVVLLPGDVEPTLSSYQASQGISLLVMGAYGHSRLRQLLLGSTTSTLLRTAFAPLLLIH